MKTFTAFLFAVMMVSLGAQNGGAATLRQSVTIDAEVVRLGDIFLDAGPKANRVVAAAPSPGRSELFNAQRLRSIADEARLGWSPRSRYEKVLVERAGQPIATAEVESALRAALNEAGAPRGMRVALARRDLGLHAALGAAEPFRVTDMRYDARSARFAAVVEVATGEKTTDRMHVTGTLYDVVPVPVLTRGLQRGDVIRKGDVETIEMARSAVPRDAMLDADRVVGQATRRMLRPGVPLNAGDLQAPVVVAKGSLVTLSLRTERMLLTAQGTAMEDGAAGETIRVLNTRSRTTVEGTVTAPGQVAVATPANR